MTGNNNDSFLSIGSENCSNIYYSRSNTIKYNSQNEDSASINDSYCKSLHESHEKWKEISPETRIECASNGYQKHGFKYNNSRGLSMLDKKLTLKSIEYVINPMKGVRILDLIFPMNSSLAHLNENTFKPLDSILEFKKTVRMVHENQEWTYFLEERFPDNSEIKGMQNLRYYNDWLNSQGNTHLHDFSLIIQSYMNNMMAMSQVLGMKNTQEKNMVTQTQNTDN